MITKETIEPIVQRLLLGHPQPMDRAIVDAWIEQEVERMTQKLRDLSEAILGPNILVELDS